MFKSSRLVFAILLMFVLAAPMAAHGQDAAGVMHCQPGPWGRIEYRYIYLAAPDNILDEYPLPSPQSRWCFVGHNLEWVQAFLATTGLDSATITRLAADPRSKADEEGVVTLFPTEDEVRDMSPAVRETLYKELGKYDYNPFYHDPICVPDGDVDAWLHGTDVPKNVVDIIRTLIYRNGAGYFFSDLRLILKYAQSDAEARRWTKALTRVRAVVADLKVDKTDDLPTLRRYWSADFHRSDSLPMLDAAVEIEGGSTLDLTHLFPPLPRRLVYSYATPDIERTGQTPNCHWTSLNFFNYTQQNILLDLKLATSAVLSDYVTASPPYAYGDVFFFLN
ncbi:MAG TPA: hypothetical protein VK737_06995, partial [Opitutales bacterium]|nr:hypothetical protein [Opitutales bacterium]